MTEFTLNAIIACMVLIACIFLSYTRARKQHAPTLGNPPHDGVDYSGGLSEFKNGDRVRLKADVDRYPYMYSRHDVIEVYGQHEEDGIVHVWVTVHGNEHTTFSADQLEKVEG